MRQKKLPSNILAELKYAIRIQLEENPQITANQLYEIVRRDPLFADVVTPGMVQNHLGNIRKQLISERKDNLPLPKEKLDLWRMPERRRLPVDKRIRAV